MIAFQLIMYAWAYILHILEVLFWLALLEMQYYYTFWHYLMIFGPFWSIAEGGAMLAYLYW